MRRLYRFLQMAVVLASLCASQTVAVLYAQQTIQQAVTAKTIEVTFEGMGSSSGDSIKLKVRKGPAAGDTPVEVTVPPGTRLSSNSRGAQGMIITGIAGRDLGGDMMSAASSIIATGAQVVSYILTAFCAEFEKENPSESTTFSLGEPDSMTKCLAERGKDLPLAALQAAIWMHTDNITYAHMSEKFSVTQSEWDEGSKVFRACQQQR